MSTINSLPWIDVKFHTNDDVVEPAVNWVGEPGGIEVDRSDKDEVGLHFRHVNDEDATISAYMTRADALALAHVLTAKALA